MFMAALFTIAKIWKQPKYPSMDKGIKKMWRACTHAHTHKDTHTHTHTKEYYSAIKKKKEIPPLTTT